mgnify:FL=1
MMKTTIAAALALALAAGSAMAEFKDFTVNGELVTKAQQEQVAAEALANNPNANQMIASPGFEDQVKQMVTEYKVMAKYARDKGIDKQDAVKEEVATMTDMILMKHAVNAYLKDNPVTEKEMKDQYQKEADRWGKHEYRIRHILVKTEKEAQDLIKEINGGASFAKLAAEKSLDEQSKSVGGILDWQSASVYTGQLSDAIKGLKKGEMSKTPVQSPAGFHVLKVEDVRDAQLFPKYEERKEEVRHLLMQRKVQAFIHDQILRADIKDVEQKK